MATLDETLTFLPKEKVVERTSLSPATIDRMVAANRFPRPCRLSRNRVAWPEPEVLAWMAARLAERDAMTAEAA